MTSKDYYSVLGLDKGASQEDIKKAYKTLAKEHHPDRGGDKGKFQELNEAHSVLSDPEKRKDYDNPARGNPFGRAGFDPFGMHRQRYDPNAPQRGRNIILEHELPMKFFILGGEFKVGFSITDNCAECGGTGAEESDTCTVCNGSGTIVDAQHQRGVFIQSSRPCPTCHGRGRRTTVPCKHCDGRGQQKSRRELNLPVPAGTREGTVLGAAGQGGSGKNGGPPGDLGVKVYMKYPSPDSLTDAQKKIIEGL